MPPWAWLPNDGRSSRWGAWVTHNRDRIRARTREGAAVPLYADHESRHAVDRLLRAAGTARGVEFADMLARELMKREAAAQRGPKNARSHSTRIRDALRLAAKDLPVHKVEPRVAVGAIYRKIEILGLGKLDLNKKPDRKTVMAFVLERANELRSELGK